MTPAKRRSVRRRAHASDVALLGEATRTLNGTLDVTRVAAQLIELVQRALGADADVVIDPVFGIGATAASRVLAVGGRLVNLGGSLGDVAEFSSSVLRSQSASVLGYTNNHLTSEQRREAITAVARAAAEGRLAVAHEVHPLAQVDQAWRRQAAIQLRCRHHHHHPQCRRRAAARRRIRSSPWAVARASTAAGCRPDSLRRRKHQEEANTCRAALQGRLRRG